MGETVQKAKDNDAKPPLTVAEIVAFKTPANLAGWRLVQDLNGGYSFRATVGGLDYIATPREWAGRTLTQGGSSMPSFTAYGAMNGVTDITSQTVGTLETNDPNINRALVPTGESEYGTACPAPEPLPQPGLTGHPLFIPVLIVGVVVFTFVCTSVLAGLTYFIFGRRSHGTS